MRRIRLQVAYDGTDFAGFQSSNDRRTVQATLQSALSRHCGEPIRVYGAGRTDAGVHAKGQVVHFDTESRTPPDRYPAAMRKILPDDLAILRSEETSTDFHARFSATRRIYRYAIHPGTYSPLVGRFAWMPMDEEPDWELLEAEASRLVGVHDFRCFRITGTQATSTVRRMYRVKVERRKCAGLITLEANAFLRGMVRWIIAALWARATGRLSPEDYTDMLNGVSRPQRLVPAPPQGLCLVEVRYDGSRKNAGRPADREAN